MTIPSDSRRGRRVVRRLLYCVAVVVVGGMAFFGLQWQRVAAGRERWSEFVNAIREGNAPEIARLTDGSTIFPRNEPGETASVCIDCVADHCGPILPLKILWEHPQEYTPQPTSLADLVEGRVRIGKLHSWAYGHFEVINNRVAFRSDIERQSIKR